MNSLSVIRASAGSGKTHYLTGFYLKILMKEPVDYFRQILAVTFTNKATGEMKRRIIGELSKLAKGEFSNHLDLLTSYTGRPEAFIREKSARILENILHDYSWFSIETIDSFFQRIIRGFTHEIGIPGNYSIEIEINPIIQHAVDALIDNVHEKTDVLNWLVQFTEERIQLGKPWDIRTGLVDLGFEVFKEKFNEHAEELIGLVADKKSMIQFRNELTGFKKSFESKLAEIGKQGIEIITRNGLNDDDFYQKSNGAGKFFRRLKNRELKDSTGELIIRSPNIQKLLESAGNWPSSTTSHKQEVIAVAEKELLPRMTQAVEFIETNYEKYATVLEILRHIYSVGLLAELAEKIKEYRLERNAFILSDSPVFISRIIDQNDAPFIYEKMGNRYGHYLIDEFQDTSVLQWKNFKPLISNALSSGNINLLVGDPKQSIYRWRNGNWEILARYINAEYPSDVLHFGTLDTNWRSGEKIVQFNNALFPTAVLHLKNRLKTLFAETTVQTTEIDLLDTIFSDVVQKYPKQSAGKGNVFVRFFTKEEVTDTPDYYGELLIDKINGLLKEGFAMREIAVLVRERSEGRMITQFLIEANGEGRFLCDLSVLSEESLLLNASDAVSLIIAAMRYINSPSDPVVGASLIVTYQVLRNTRTLSGNEVSLDGNSLNYLLVAELLPEFYDRIAELSSMPVYELAENLIFIFRLNELVSELPFIHSLLDLLHDYTISNPSDLARFLDYWDESGCNKSVPASESQNAVRVMTIHKAKGLQFRAVIIPFCNWKIDQHPGTILWAEAKGKGYSLLPVIPLNYQKGLRDTEFAKEYFSELFKSYVDNLNLLYVALTRAIDTLIIFQVYSAKEKGNTKLVTVGDLLYESIMDGNNDILLSGYDKTANTLEFKSEAKLFAETDQVDIADEYFSCGKGAPAFERISFRAKGMEYFNNLNVPTVQGNIRGSVLHEVLASIKTHNELNKAIRQAALDGLISGHEGHELRNHVLECFNLNIVFSWFNGSGQVLTERDILLPDGEIKRPDRIVLFHDKVHVIDYKFGDEKYIDLHRNQVKDYITQIERMGYSQVEGFIWYIDQNKVIIA